MAPGRRETAPASRCADDVVTDPAPALTLEIWSDVVCSWCYVGKRYLEQALEMVPDRELVDLRWRSFELDPTLPADAGSADEELARRHGISLEEARAMHEETERMGAEMGLTFDFARARRGNTFDAHRVLHMAHAAGLQNAVQDQLMAAYFAEGEPIGDPAALAAAAGRGGLDPTAVSEMLASDGYVVDVRADENDALELGISSVPFFVFNRRYGLAGAHPPDAIVETVRPARRGDQTVCFSAVGHVPVTTGWRRPLRRATPDAPPPGSDPDTGGVGGPAPDRDGLVPTGDAPPHGCALGWPAP